MSFPAICFSYFDSSEIFKVLFKNWPKIIEIFIFIITKKKSSETSSFSLYSSQWSC